MGKTALWSAQNWRKLKRWPFKFWGITECNSEIECGPSALHCSESAGLRPFTEWNSEISASLRPFTAVKVRACGPSLSESGQWSPSLYELWLKCVSHCKICCSALSRWRITVCCIVLQSAAMCCRHLQTPTSKIQMPPRSMFETGSRCPVPCLKQDSFVNKPYPRNEPYPKNEP